MQKKTFLIIGIFAFSIIAFSSSNVIVGNAQDDAELPAVVKIGFLYPATGGLGPIGEGLLDGANAAIWRLNNDHDVEFKLVSADTGTDGPTGKTAAQSMVSDGVQVVVGSAASGVTLAASEVTIPNHVPQISYASTSPAISKLGDDDYLFRVVASDAYQGQALATLAKNKGVTKAFVLNLDNAYGNGVEREFTKKFVELGGEVTQKIAYDENAASYATEITSIKDSDADGIIIVAYPEDSLRIFAEAKTQNVDLNWYGTDGIASGSVTGNEGTEDYTNGTLFGTTPSSGTSPGVESKFQQYTGDLVRVDGSQGIFGDYAYDAVLLAGTAVLDAGVYNGTLIRDSIYKVANGFSGATGADKALNCDGEPVSQEYDVWAAVNGEVTTETARFQSFDGLGAVADAPCGENTYVPPTASPGFEFLLFFSAISAISVISIRKRKK